ncbi:MAG: sulfurtransferase [Rhodospirillales bacterium]|nr:sulfurtransferase [Rhodospirillales bacterium]
MRRLLFAAAAILGSAVFGVPAYAATPLVDVEWMKANAGKPGIVVLDIREDGVEAYGKGHIPGAVYTSYDKGGWRVKDKNGTPGMLPEAAALEKLIGGLGIDSRGHVVIVADGTSARDMGRATRIYWTFKVVGHDAVSILDGGFSAWVADKKNPVEAGIVRPQPATFKVAMRPELLATKGDVEAALARGTPLIDNRPPDMYVGVNRTKDVLKNGTLPGARSVPESWLTENNGGKFRDSGALAKLYAAAGVPTSGEQITFCNTGHWASLGWFVSSELLGNKQTKMYDGSMAEWSRDDKLPVETKVKVQ